jgi:hypothetical protein
VPMCVFSKMSTISCSSIVAYVGCFLLLLFLVCYLLIFVFCFVCFVHAFRLRTIVFLLTFELIKVRLVYKIISHSRKMWVAYVLHLVYFWRLEQICFITEIVYRLTNVDVIDRL